MRVLKKVLKVGGVALLVLFALLLVTGAYLYSRAKDQVYAEYTGDPPSVLRYYDEAAPEPRPAAAEPEASEALFNPDQFREPDKRFGPWTRWWWPGNDVEPEELRREIQMFADHGFGGVEIQPFTCGLDPNAPAAERDGVFSYDTEAYFENLRVVMRAAREAGLGVDISAGGGWPSGGPHIAPEDNFKTLAYSETTVSGGHEVTVEIPRPSAPFIYWAMGPVAGYLMPGLGGNLLYFYQDQAELVEVVAARVVEDGRSSLPWKLDDQVVLDRTDVQLLGNQVDGERRLSWTAPPGTWRIVGIWSMPDGEPPTLIPSRDRGLVVDHFDRQRVTANYNYLFGERAGLAEFHGDPFRAIFNDSYEFKADRHFAAGFLDEFETRRGYDVGPWLPAMLRPVYDNMLANLMIPGARAAFRFSDDDERVNYDYDLTISELFIERFLATSTEWMAARGLQNRTQAYGFRFDIIQAMGHAHIPETEQLAGDGSQMFLRMASSGAELYNRPVVTSESLVWMGRDHMTTPQKAKIAADKLFTSGINQVIYHGTPYRYHTDFFGAEGWQPFASPAMRMMSFSSNISESDAYWKYQQEMNRYIARSQYVLRLGRRATDVLIYYPFLGNTIRGQEGEHLNRGLLEGPEPGLTAMPIDIDELPSGEQPTWEARAWKAIRELDRQGISWAWVNDDSLQAATWKEGTIDIRGNAFQAVLLLDVPWLQTGTAGHLAEMAEEGARVVVLGPPPARQPGYLDYEENDKRVKGFAERILASESAMHLQQPADLGGLTETLLRHVAYAEPYSFLKRFDRALDDGSRLVFLWNTSDEDVRVRLRLSDDRGEAYWLDPADGKIHPAQGDPAQGVSGSLGPYGSIVLYAGARQEIPEGLLSLPPVQRRFDEMVALQTLDLWDLRAGPVSRANTALVDWRDDAELRHSSDLGTYTAVFTLEERDPAERYLVDLGDVYFTADVRVNEQDAGTLLFAPYRLDVTDHLVAGENQIEVTVTPAPRNGFIGRALAGEEPYERLESEADRLMSAGLAGPVRLMALEATD